VRYPLKDALELDLVPHCALTALRSPVTLRRWYSNERTMSSLYYSGDTRTNQGTSLRHPGDARRRAQIRSDILRQAAEDLVNEQAQVERRDPLSRDSGGLNGARILPVEVCYQLFCVYVVSGFPNVMCF
jgi:hypothetical protein